MKTFTPDTAHLNTGCNRNILFSRAAFLFVIVLLSFSIRISAQQLYGGFTFGGPEAAGRIGHYDFATKLMVDDYSFKTQFRGSYPYGSVIEVNGKLYGMTSTGGLNNQGVLFEWDIASQTYTSKIDFKSPSAHPYSTLSYLDGRIYGTTSSGFFEWDIATNDLTVKKSFSYADGWGPFGAMTLVNGKFYGTTSSGGSYTTDKGYGGVIFEWDPATNSYTKKHEFKYVDGAHSYASLCHYNGKLFGVTSYGGSHNYGVLFEFDLSTGQYQKKLDFTGPNGRHPFGGLVEMNGKLYGTTQYGGITFSETNSGYGILFEWDPQTDTFTKKSDLYQKGIYYPLAALSPSDGKLFGTGSNVLFEYDPASDVVTSRRYFDGSYPRGALTFVNGTDCYGLASSGGASGRGTFFKWTPSTNAYAKLLDFMYSPEGLQPHPRFLDIGDGKLYGITSQGGERNAPAIFEYDPKAKTFTRRIEIPYTTPSTSLSYSRGTFYLTTYFGLYEWDKKNNTLILKTQFSSTTTGYGASGDVVYHDGKFYGATTYGGGASVPSTNYGVIFEWDPETNIYTKKHDFNYIDGANPLGSLTFYNGKFYGTTVQGGANGFGVLFEWDPSTNEYKKIIDFDSKARHPYGGLTLFGNKLYGSNNSGDGSYGSLFEFDPASKTISQRFLFQDYSKYGGHPQGIGFTEVNGTLYGLVQGGTYGYGVLFAWDPAVNSVSARAHLQSTYYGGTSFSRLSALGTKKSQSITFTDPGPKTYGDQAFTLDASSSLGKTVEFFSSDPKVVRIEKNQVTIVSAGTVTIRAFHDGDNYSYPATPVEIKLTVAKAPQTITFAELPEKTTNDPPFVITATSSSGLPVTFESSDPRIATVSGNTVTVVGEGTVYITARQPGDKNFLPAESIARTLTISGKEEQEIHFPEIPSDLFVGQSYRLGATSTSGLGVTYSIGDASLGVIEGGSITLLKGGTTVITASQAGNEDYHPAEDVQRTLDVHSIDFMTLLDVYCAGNTFSLAFDVAGTFDEYNYFTLELSSATGSFDEPVVLATSNGNTSGIFHATIPDGAARSSSYRMRITSSVPRGIVVADKEISIDTAPLILSLSAPVDPVPVDNPVSASLEFSDEGLSYGTIDWGDGVSTAGEINGSMVSASHIYTAPGVYTVVATIGDACGKVAEARHQYVVIYDPYGGFVTGGGWFESPPGAYPQDPQATGKASFGFVAKYQKGSTIPAGNTDFQFHAASLRFKSTSYEWLVVAGTKAMYKGTGQFNGVSGYGFMISAVDGDKNAGADKFRIKISDPSGAVVYDNQMGDADDAEAVTAIAHGSIVIHDANKTDDNTARIHSESGEGALLLEGNAVTAYPNPFVGDITVEYRSDLAHDVNIHLLDVTGKTLYAGKFAISSDGLYHLDLSPAPLSQQIYLLKINQGQRVVFMKVARK